MLEIFSTREVATGIYLTLFFVIAFMFHGFRIATMDIIKVVCGPTSVKTTCRMLLYGAILVYGLQFLPFWKWLYLKDLLIWVLVVAVPTYSKAIRRKVDKHCFKNIIVTNLKFITFAEFFINSFTFSLLIELLIQPVFLLLFILQLGANETERGKPVKKLLDCIFVITALIIWGFTIKTAIQAYSLNGTVDLLVSFLIPFVCSCFYLPIIYTRALYAEYRDLFWRIKIRNNTNHKMLLKKRLSVFGACGVSYSKLKHFSIEYGSNYIRAVKSGYDDKTFFDFVKSFKTQYPSHRILRHRRK